MMSISVEAAEARDSLSDDREIVNTYEVVLVLLIMWLIIMLVLTSIVFEVLFLFLFFFFFSFFIFSCYRG